MSDQTVAPDVDPIVGITGVNPIGDRVLVKLQDAPTHTPSGLSILDPAEVMDEKYGWGQIVAVPEMASKVLVYDKGTLELGEYVMFVRHAGVEVTISPDEYVVVRAADVIATVEVGKVMPPWRGGAG